MIIKSYNLNNINNKSKFLLFYGENEGHKDDVINDYFLKNFKGEIVRYDENQILGNKESFFELCLNESLFEDSKIIIVSRVTSKLLEIIKEITGKDIYNKKIIFRSGQLEKKSKLREFFEKKDNLISVAFYEDNNATLYKIASNFFRENKIAVSSENINLIIDRCLGDRKNLQNEMNKILNYCFGKKKITTNEILKLISLQGNDDVYELVDFSLTKNLNKVIKQVNNNIFSKNDAIILIRAFLLRIKRLVNLKKLSIEEGNIQSAINKFKPTIFWKEKDIVEKQLKIWTLEQMYELIDEINNLELNYKKNSDLSNNLILDLIISSSKNTSSLL